MEAKDEARYWKKVRKTSDCWLWTGALNGEGRGRFTVDKRTVYAYVAALILSGIEVAPGQIVRHLCGNPSCVRPDHLDPNGGQRENNLDTVEHGRHRSVRLNAQKARRIRERWAAPGRPLQAELAREFDVSPSAISEVVTGKSWPRAGGPVGPSRRSTTPKPPSRRATSR